MGDERDITLKGKDAIDTCDSLFLEAYTSILGVKKERLVCMSGSVMSSMSFLPGLCIFSIKSSPHHHIF